MLELAEYYARYLDNRRKVNERPDIPDCGLD
jgi:hypothetical protein